MFRRRMMATAAIAAALALTTLTGCSTGGSSGSGSEGSGGTLTLGMQSPPNSLSAQNAAWADQSPYAQAVYDTLLRAAPDGTVESNLATEWEFNDAKTVLTLTLRDDVTFSDGSELTAEVVVQNLLRYKEGTSPNASFLSKLTDATALDATHVQLTLAAPDPALPVYLTQAAGLVASADAFDNPDVETNPIGSGPYILDKDATVVGSSYVYDKNPDYWNPDAQHYDKLVLNYYADQTALLNAVRGGQVSASQIIDGNQVEQVEAAGWTVTPFANNWWGFIIGDREGALTPALGDVRVRQAVNYAVDREALMEVFANGRGSVTQQIFPPTSTSYSDELDARYSYDPEKARELLAEAGYADGFDITIPTTAAFGSSNFTILKQQLEDVGIRVTYEDLAVNDYINAIIGGSYSMALMGLQTDPTDWQLSQFDIDKDSTWNGFHTDDPTVQGYIATLQTGSEDEAEAAGAALNEYIVEQAWFAPWFRPDNFFATAAGVSATTQVGNSYPYLWNIVPAN